LRTRFAIALSLVFVLGLFIVPPSSVEAAGCVRLVATNFDAPGNDNYASKLNGEWVRIKNVCGRTKRIDGWKIHDYGKKNVYKFKTGVKIRPGQRITLKSGRGTDTAAKKYWGRRYGAIWDNTPPERAYLRNRAGKIKSTRSE
jgi:hypothetical protein